MPVKGSTDQILIAAWSVPECVMQGAGVESSNTPCLAIEFGNIMAIENDTQVRPDKATENYWEKPFHGHGANLPMPTSIRPSWAGGAR